MKRNHLLTSFFLVILLVATACGPQQSQQEDAEPTNPVVLPTDIPPTEAPDSDPTTAPTEAPTATEEPVEPTPTDNPTETSPPPTAEPTATSAPAQPTSPPAPADYAPTNRSVWQLGLQPVSTSSSDACGGAFSHDFYGLVAVTPGQGNITWMRAQDNIPYTLQLTSLNNYAGSGQSALAGFSLNIRVTFTSATTLSVVYTLTPADNTSCNHSYTYNGTFNW